MKTLKIFISALLVGSCAFFVQAANETDVTGNLGDGVSMGSVHTSSGTSRRWESRRIDTNDSGNIKTAKEEFELVRSTGAGTGGLYVAGNTTLTYVNALDSWFPTTGTCRGLQDNCNIIRYASQSEKVYVDKIRLAQVNGGGPDIGGIAGQTTIRFFDSQGSTATAFEVFRWAGSSNTTTQVEMWFSSGVTVKKDTLADLFIYLGKQNR